MESTISYNEFGLAILVGMAQAQPAHVSAFPISTFTHTLISYFLASEDVEPDQPDQKGLLFERAGQIAKALGVDHLTNHQKITKVFQILHSEKLPATKRTLDVDEFKAFRRSLGNSNYNKCFELLRRTLKGKKGQTALNVAVAAYFLGTVKGASSPYKNFIKRLV